jgi:hypothetical protein
MTPPAPGALGPTAQAMLIRHLLRNDEGPVPSMMLAASLGPTSLSPQVWHAVQGAATSARSTSCRRGGTFSSAPSTFCSHPCC